MKPHGQKDIHSPPPTTLEPSPGAPMRPIAGRSKADPAPAGAAAPMPTVRWRVQGGLDFATVAGIQRHALAELPLHRRFALVLDLSQVDTFDAAGLQLLLSIRHTLGTAITIEAPAPAVAAFLPWFTSGPKRASGGRTGFSMADGEPGVHDARGSAGDWLIGLDTWHLSLRFDEDAFRHGFDPLGAVGSLRALGVIVNASVVDDRVPTLPLLNPAACKLGFELDLRTDFDADQVRSAIDALGKHAWVRAISPAASIDEYVTLIHTLPEGAVRASRLLLDSGVLTPQELEYGLRALVRARAAIEAVETPRS